MSTDVLGPDERDRVWRTADGFLMRWRKGPIPEVSGWEFHNKRMWVSTARIKTQGPFVEVGPRDILCAVVAEQDYVRDLTEAAMWVAREEQP